MPGLLVDDSCGHLQDVAIAWGYNNLDVKVPQTVTVGSELPLNQLTEMLRMECAMAGFTEIATWALVSRAENFASICNSAENQTAVSVGNPATVEFEVCRTSLLPGEHPQACSSNMISIAVVHSSNEGMSTAIIDVCSCCC